MDVEREFERFVERIGDPQPPRDAHRRELRARVLATAAASGEPDLVSKPKRWRTIMNNRMIRWSATAIALLVVVTVVCFSGFYSPTAAWADVQKTFDQVTSFSLKIAVYQDNKLRQEETISFLDTDRMRVDARDGSSVMDWAQGKTVSLMPEQKVAVVGTLKDGDESGRRNWLAHLKAIMGREDAEQVGDETFEGRRCKGWRVGNDVRSTTVWADAKTAQIARIEMEMKAGSVRTVMTDFKFNPTLDESLFSLDVPEGYQIIASGPVSARGSVMDDFVLLLRAWAGGNGGVFPDSLVNVPAWFIAATKYDWSKETMDEETMKTMIGRAFFSLNANQNWAYCGKGVKVGEAERAIFWKPSARGKYQVIYGDLSVREVEKKDLPK